MQCHPDHHSTPATCSASTCRRPTRLAVALALAAGETARVRRAEARALGGFVPDCLVLFRRLLGDGRVPRAPKLAVGLGIAYLALPFDLVPDFIPVAGQLDDVLIVALVLRFAVRGGGPGLLEEHWPGPPRGRNLIHRLAFGGSAASRPA